MTTMSTSLWTYSLELFCYVWVFDHEALANLIGNRLGMLKQEAVAVSFGGDGLLPYDAINSSPLETSIVLAPFCKCNTIFLLSETK